MTERANPPPPGRRSPTIRSCWDCSSCAIRMKGRWRGWRLDRTGAGALPRHGTCRGARYGGRPNGRSGRPQPRASDERRNCGDGRLSAHRSADRQSESAGAQTAGRDRRARARSDRPSARRADLCGGLRELSRMVGPESDLGLGDDRGARAQSTTPPRSMSRKSSCSVEDVGRPKRAWLCRPSARPIRTLRSRLPRTMSQSVSAPRARG
jgi:hypothetical protein